MPITIPGQVHIAVERWFVPRVDEVELPSPLAFTRFEFHVLVWPRRNANDIWVGAVPAAVCGQNGVQTLGDARLEELKSYVGDGLVAYTRREPQGISSSRMPYPIASAQVLTERTPSTGGRNETQSGNES